MNADADAEAIFREGVRAVQPRKLIHSAVTVRGKQLSICGKRYPLSSLANIYVTGAGKATAGMALALEELLGKRISEGLIAVKYGHDLPLRFITQIEAAHPVPDENGLKAAAEVHTLLTNTSSKDLVICLLSGGASALLADCPAGINLEDLRTVSDLLLRSGSDITAINTVRKHLSTLKGGQLARCAYPAALESLIISDVVGDDPAVIASGPASPDPGTFGEALQLLEHYGLTAALPAPVLRYLERGERGEIPETPKPGEPFFSRVRNHIIGSNKLALSAAAMYAGELGYHTRLLGSRAEGPAVELADYLITQALEYQGPLPACLLLGGESTVKVGLNGKGGRNQHLALAAAIALEKSRRGDGKKITVLSAGTDGTDGPTDAAGAVAGIPALEKARRLGLRPRDFLEKFDSYHFFEQVGGHIHTGPTQSNVMDLMVVLIR